jgi:hypothetical protein
MAASDESQATMEVRIHPLVVMAIADHYTMEKEQKQKKIDLLVCCLESRKDEL